MKTIEFSADKAAFFIFEDRPDKRALFRLGWAYVLGRLILTMIVIAVAIPFLLSMIANLGSLQTNPAQAQPFANIVFVNFFQAISLLGSLLFLPLFISIYTALLRWMIFEKSGGKWFGLRFGEQEMNVLVAFIALFLVLILGLLLSAIPVGILAAITAVSMKAGHGALLLAVTILTGLVWFGGFIWVAVRLSPAPALTVKRGKIQIFEAFAVSKGHFWGLFLAYLLQFFITIAISIGIVFLALLIALPFLGVGVALFGWGKPGMAHIGAYIGLATVPVLFLIFLGLALEYLRYAFGAGVGACLVMSQTDPEKVPGEEAAKTA